MDSLNIKALVDDIRKDEEESINTLHLTSNENRTSKLAQSFFSSPLSFRYIFGSNPSDIIETATGLMLKGMPGVVNFDNIAQNTAKKMFHASLSNFRPTSGLHTTFCTINGATNVGDVIYSIDPDDGGHFATRHLVERCGRKSQFIPWDNKNLAPDLDLFRKKIKRIPPDVILFEHGTPLFNLPTMKVREIVGDKVLIVYDASHTLGLIAGGFFQDPLREGCDILQGNTHKTFPGPQKGMIHFKDSKLGQKVIKSIGDGLISSQHVHHAIAEYITVLEIEKFGRDYAKQMILNGKKLAESLVNEGFDLLEKDGVYTTSHELLIKGSSTGGHFEGCRRLLQSGISANARVAFKTEVIRLGTQEVTRRGMKEDDMEYIAKLFRRIILDKEPIDNVKKDVISFNNNFLNIHYSFDKEFNYWKY